MRKILILLLFFLLAQGAVAQGQLKPNYPKVYTVQKHDTLWKISTIYLKDPWLWPSLWRCNPQLHNPHLIYPGDSLSVQIINGQACMQLKPHVVKLSPHMRIEPSVNPIPPIPMKLIEPFLTKSRVMNLKTFLKAPYVIAHEGEHLISTRGNSVYVRGITDSQIRDYVILHRDEIYVDPQTKEVLGIEARYKGAAKVEKIANVSSLKVTDAVGVINKGDRLFPVLNKEKLLEFIPSAPTDHVNVQIIAILRGVSQVGRFNVVALNYGSNKGAQPGQILNIMRLGKSVEDLHASSANKYVRLPNIKIGELMVFRTFNKVSFALVMQAKQAVRILDKVVSPT